jgi:hypothetical protein
MKSGNNFLETSGPLQACNRTALHTDKKTYGIPSFSFQYTVEPITYPFYVKRFNWIQSTIKPEIFNRCLLMVRIITPPSTKNTDTNQIQQLIKKKRTNQQIC